MNIITIVVLIFSTLGAIDLLLGNKFGLGAEFERAFLIFKPMVISMLGMLVVAPAIGAWMTPVFDWFYNIFGVDPSIIPASLFGNDMGGVTLAQSVCKAQDIGAFNAFIVSSMMGCVISFTIPFSISVVKKEQHEPLFLGMLCGIVTIPIGCFAAGLICGLNIPSLLIDLLPLILLSLIIGLALIFFQKICIKIFSALGFAVRAISIVGLICAIFTFLTKIEINANFDTLENASFICVNACVTLSGVLPLMHLVSKLLDKPLHKFGSKIGIDSISAVALLSTLASNTSTFSVMDKMNKKGVVLNSAFAVSAAFVFGSHLAFTMAYDSSYVAPMMVGKLISGICALLLALLMYKDDRAPQENHTESYAMTQASHSD